MAGSQSSKVIVCINKCGLYLDKLKIEPELKEKEDPITYMKERYASKLNKHLRNSKFEHFRKGKFEVKKEHFLFTDWKVTDEGKKFGIEGVEDVKEVIKDHLVELNVIGKDDLSGLESAVSPPQNKQDLNVSPVLT